MLSATSSDWQIYIGLLWHYFAPLWNKPRNAFFGEPDETRRCGSFGTHGERPIYDLGAVSKMPHYSPTSVIKPPSQRLFREIL